MTSGRFDALDTHGPTGQESAVVRPGRRAFFTT